MTDTMDEILTLHFPRYEELPDLDIYMDQVLQLLNRYFAIFQKNNDEPIMTKTMINNYVKHGILMPPHKKKYTRDHLAYLVVICLMKQVFSMSEISLLIQFQIKAYPIAKAYNYFCEELETCLKATFTHSPLEHVKASNQDEFEVFLLQNTILSIVEKIYVQLSIRMLQQN